MASYTNHLKLLKKDPVADGADTFNIDTMLNDNWDKVDEAVGRRQTWGRMGKYRRSSCRRWTMRPH